MSLTKDQLIDLCSIVESLKFAILADTESDNNNLSHVTLEVLERRFWQLAKLAELLTKQSNSLPPIQN